MEWLSMSAGALGRAIGAGKADPVDLCDAFLAAIDGHQFAARIYARTTPERARSEALAASARAREGGRLSPLDGVPISWKDLFDSAGVATESGSALLKGRVPEADADDQRIHPYEISLAVAPLERHRDGTGLSGQDASNRTGIFRSWLQSSDRIATVHQ